MLTAPVVAIAEAKNDNLRTGLGQCIAAMVGARDFNSAAAVRRSASRLGTNFTDTEVGMKTFSVSTIIQATPDVVWALLVDGAQWTAWNPTIEKVEGTIAPGGKLKVYTKLSPGRAFPVRVSEFAPPRRMVWTGGMPFGLFQGVRSYVLSPVSDGVEFAMREEFSGLMAPLITRSIPDLQPSFDEFAAALKRRAEQ